MPTSLQLATLFTRLPAPARQGVILVQSAANRLNRYGREYRSFRDLYEKSQRWSSERLREYQQQQLLLLLREAKDTTVHYGDALRSLTDADLANVAETLDMERLPLLEKAELKRATATFFNRKRKTSTRSATSGSTGSPLVVEYDRASVEQRFALLHRLRGWGGLEPFARCVRLSGRQIAPSDSLTAQPWLNNPFENMLVVSTYHLREPMLGRIADRLLRFQPRLIEGYPTAVAQLAEYFARKRLALPSLKMVITTAETLGPEMRELIHSSLGAPVFDYYAASEGVPLVAQCERGSYHVWEDSGVFEFLTPEGRRAAPGEMGEMVVTSFCQWKTPLIRYRTGDLALLPTTPTRCDCGRAFPVIESVLGRVEDLVHTPDGRRIGMFAYRTLKHVPGIREGQIIQEAAERFRVLVALDASRELSAIDADVRRIFASTLGYAPTVSLEPVEAIARGPNGKFRSVVRTFDVAAHK